MALATSAFVASRLDAAVAGAPPLAEATERALAAQSDPSFAACHPDMPLPTLESVVAALGLPERSASPPDAGARLPRRVLAGVADDAERSLWRAYAETGIHEVLSRDLLDALSWRIRRRVAQVTLGGLQGRSDLNGERAVVIGPCDAKGRVPVRVRSSGECVRARVANAFRRGDGELPTVLELGAGSGALSLALAPRLAGWATVVAVDDMSSRIRTMSDVEKLDHEAALRLHAPTLVLVSWMPSGVDFSGAIRACESVVEYVLLGEADSDTCGDGWATWGVMPDNGYEYGLDEDSVPPARQDGFERATLAACAACQVCRFDSAAGRGFSTTVAFTRRGAVDEGEALEAEDDGETLEQSWERMQRSLAAGRAERMAVEMEARVHEAAASDHESADLEGLERMAAALKAKMGSG